MKQEIKSIQGWRDSKLDLYNYLQKNDKVNEGLVDEILNCLPPATHTSRCVQLGEPYDHCPATGIGRYATFHKKNGEWFFTGNMTTKEAKNYEA